VLKAKRDEAAAQLETYRLEAPFDGFVTRVHLVTGASVKQGDSIIELVNTSKVRVEGTIVAKDAALVRPGCQVEVQLDKPEEVGARRQPASFQGESYFVDIAKVTAVGSKVRVWAEVENADKVAACRDDGHDDNFSRPETATDAPYDLRNVESDAVHAATRAVAPARRPWSWSVSISSAAVISS